jgi:hypothetical protein
VRPILARKNRYYQDAFFKKRLIKPPQHATPAGLKSMPKPASLDEPASSVDAESMNAIEPVTQPKPRSREAGVKDIDRIDSLTLEDFDLDLSRIEIPEKAEGERLTDHEMHAAVESFLSSLKER